LARARRRSKIARPLPEPPRVPSPPIPDSAAAPAPRLLPAGDTGLVVEFGSTIDPALNARVQALDAALAAALPPGVVETVPTLRSLLIHYDPLVTDADRLAAAVHRALDGLEAAPAAAGHRWTLPVRYGGAHGPDLDEAARSLGLGPAELVRRHGAAVYTVAMLGFQPGCPFCLGLPAELALPRRPQPRLRVPAGTLAMAMRLSLIYPVDSPGGWTLLGNCPVPLFDLARAPATLLAPGDELRFAAVDEVEFGRLRTALARGEIDPVREWRA
jgi:KipI family sensor histidine kinase inhibitor